MMLIGEHSFVKRSAARVRTPLARTGLYRNGCGGSWVKGLADSGVLPLGGYPLTQRSRMAKTVVKRAKLI